MADYSPLDITKTNVNMPQQNTGNALTNFLASPGGAATINAIGGAASSIGASQQADANRQQSASQFAANSLLAQSQQDRNNAQAALTPLGANQRFAGGNALGQAILGNMKPVHFAQQANPTQNSMVPDGGFDPVMLNNVLGPQATLSSIAQHDKQLSAINPTAPIQNYQDLGFKAFGDNGAPGANSFQQQAASYASQVKGTQDQQRAQINAMLQHGLDQENQSSNPADGFWHKFAKWAGIAGAGALTVFSGGLGSPVLAAALGAAASGATAWGSGAGAGGTLAAAGLGGLAGNSLKKGITGTGNVTSDLTTGQYS